MKISAQISYYPLDQMDYKAKILPVIQKIEQFAEQKELQIQITPMATLLYGEKSPILSLISEIFEEFFNSPSILDIKFSNACWDEE